MSSVIMK